MESPASALREADVLSQSGEIRYNGASGLKVGGAVFWSTPQVLFHKSLQGSFLPGSHTSDRKLAADQSV